MKELLITGAWRCGEQQVQALEQMGYAVTFWPDERQAVNMDTRRFEAVICGGLFLTTPIERFPALKCIQVTSAGLDRVPLDYCKAHGITVYNAGGVYSAPMAEFVLGGILQLYKESKFLQKIKQRIGGRSTEACGNLAARLLALSAPAAWAAPLLGGCGPLM